MKIRVIVQNGFANCLPDASWPQQTRARRAVETVRVDMRTIRDVAAKAGVSISTVSIALSGAGPVSEETRRKVLEAAATVGYVPNPLARGLRYGASRHIGLIAGDLTNPYAGAVLRAVERAVAAAGYAVIVANSDGDPAREAVALDMLEAQRVAGILLNPVGQGAGYRDRLQQVVRPLVTFDQQVTGLERDFVGVDSEAAGRMLAEYLLRLGHRRIAFIGGRSGLWTAEMRLSGFKAALAVAGIEADPGLIVVANYRGDEAYRETTALLSRGRRPTAILAANNLMALGALQAVLDLGFRCPSDVSVVGIDDVPWSGLVKPRLTIVAQPIEDLAHTATTWLLERIERGSAAQLPPRRFVAAPYFVMGESCADLRVPELSG
jgi:LacI family transcriptional regulator